MLPRHSLQQLVDPLQDALEADVLPVACRQASPHDEPGRRQLLEVLLRGVTPDDVPTGHHDQGGVRRAAEDADRFARLDDERLVLRQSPQRGDEAGEGSPVASRLGAGGVDDEVLGSLADLEDVLEHAQQPFLPPAGTTQLGAPSRPRTSRLGSHSDVVGSSRHGSHSDPDVIGSV